jgi:hypothetical protein
MYVWLFASLIRPSLKISQNNPAPMSISIPDEMLKLGSARSILAGIGMSDFSNVSTGKWEI